MEHAAPQALVDRLVDRFTRLLATLEAERAALIDHSPQSLEDVVPAKEALCTEIARDQQQLLTALDSTPEQQPAGMDELRELAHRCRTENAVNGRIVNRARHTTRTLLDLLTGEPPSDLYQPAGHQSPTTPRPSTGQSLGSA